MFAEINKKNPKEALAELLYISPSNYNKYSVTINKKYSGCQPAIFYTALSRGYKKINFAEMSKDIIYQLKENVK